ncbi:MAG TPA: Hsp20/alpha crystallin family protein, partial [Chloroflexota bacterium]
EIWRGQFQRSFRLPIQVDANKADASYEHGVLRLTLPKSETTKPKKIQVRSQQPTIQQQSGSGTQGAESSQNVQTERVPVKPGE